MHRWASESKSWRLAGQEHRLPQSICHSSASLGERVQALALSKARAPSPAVDLPIECLAGRESPSLGAQQAKSTVSRNRATKPAIRWARESKPWRAAGKSTISHSRSANRVHRWASESKPWRSARQEHHLPQSICQSSASLGERVQALARGRQEHRLPQSICQSSASLGERVQALALSKARAPSPAVDLPIDVNLENTKSDRENLLTPSCSAR